MSEYGVIAILCLIMLTASWVIILALWQRKEYHQALGERFRATSLTYYDTIQKNARRITELKDQLRTSNDNIKLQKSTLDQLCKSAKDDQDTIAQLQETIRDLETVIGMKDEELAAMEEMGFRRPQDDILRESTKLVDSLRGIVLEKCRELKTVKSYLVHLGFDPEVILKNPDLSVEGQPYFSQIGEPDPDNNRPEMDGCEVCEAEQLSTPALGCETTDAAVGC